MGLKDKLSEMGSSGLGIIFFLALCSLPAVFLLGAEWLGEKLLPFLLPLSMITLAICILILLPLAIFRATRPLAGNGFFIGSYVFGVTGWFMGLLLTLTLWGGVAALFGLFFFGIGVVPIAMLATLFNGMWLELGLLILAIVLTFGCRILGLVLLVD